MSEELNRLESESDDEYESPEICDLGTAGDLFLGGGGSGLESPKTPMSQFASS